MKFGTLGTAVDGDLTRTRSAMDRNIFRYRLRPGPKAQILIPAMTVGWVPFRYALRELPDIRMDAAPAAGGQRTTLGLTPARAHDGPLCSPGPGSRPDRRRRARQQLVAIERP